MHQEDTLADWENIVYVCFGRASEDDLPQVETEEDVIIDLMQERTHHSRGEVQEEIHQYHNYTNGFEPG